MKLIQSSASPFARKARIIIHETGLQSRVSEVDPGAVTPVSNNVSVNAINPLGMIPALELDNGDCLFDSTVICEYLNTLGGGTLYPENPDAYLQSRKLASLADGVLDLSVALRYETALRPEKLRWEEFINHSTEKVERALDYLESSCKGFNQDFTIGELSVVCALGYRDFRFSEPNWRPGRPQLNAWFDEISTRPSIAATAPV